MSCINQESVKVLGNSTGSWKRGTFPPCPFSMHVNSHIKVQKEYKYDKHTIHQTPIKQWIIDKSFKNSHDTFSILTKHLHHTFAGQPVIPVNASYLLRNKTGYQAETI